MTYEEKVLALLENMNERLTALEKGREEDSKRLIALEEGRNDDYRRLIYLEENSKTLGRLMDLVATQVNMLTMDMGEIKQKLDQKSDKSDIIRLENTIIPKTKAVFNGYAQHSDQLRRHELILQKIK